MHQQIHCHTLPKPFSKIFLFRIYAPTIYNIDFELNETSAPVYTHLRAHPASTNQSTNDTVHTHKHRYHTHTHPTDSAPIQPHKNTATQPHKHPQPYADTHATPSPADVDDVDADALDVVAAPTLSTHREAMPYLDVDAQPASSGLTVRPFRPDTPSQHRCSRRVRNSTGHVLVIQPAMPPYLDRPRLRDSTGRRPNDVDVVDAIVVDAVDADAGAIGPPGPIISRAFRLDCKPAHERHLEDSRRESGTGHMPQA